MVIFNYSFQSSSNYFVSHKFDDSLTFDFVQTWVDTNENTLIEVRISCVTSKNLLAYLHDVDNRPPA